MGSCNEVGDLPTSLCLVLELLAGLILQWPDEKKAEAVFESVQSITTCIIERLQLSTRRTKEPITHIDLSKVESYCRVLATLTRENDHLCRQANCNIGSGAAIQVSHHFHPASLLSLNMRIRGLVGQADASINTVAQSSALDHSPCRFW